MLPAYFTASFADPNIAIPHGLTVEYLRVISGKSNIIYEETVYTRLYLPATHVLNVRPNNMMYVRIIIDSKGDMLTDLFRRIGNLLRIHRLFKAS